MTGTNFFTSSDFNPNVSIALTNIDRLAMLGSFIGSVPTDVDVYAKGCFMIKADGGSGLYQNIGTPAVPNFQAIGGGAGNPAGSDTWVQWNNNGVFGADGDFVRGSNSSFFGVNSSIALNKDVRYAQDMNLFGIGIDGVLNAYSPDGFGSSFIGTLAGDFTGVGGADKSMIVGYQSFAGGAIANTTYSYATVTNEAQARLEASTLTKQARINVEADTLVSTIDFDFGGSQKYTFPSVQPSTGEVLGYVSANTLGWVSAPTADLTIGSPITGGGANRILFEDASNNLAESSDFAFNQVTGVFSLSFSGANRLLINPVSNQYYIGNGGTGDTLVELLDVGIGTSTIRNWVSGSFLVEQGNAGPRLIDGNTTTFNLYMGDVGTVANGTVIELLDAIKTINIKVHTSGGSGGLLKIGDTNSDGNDTMWQLDDFSKQTFVQTNGDFGVQTSVGQRALNINMNSGVGNWYGEFGANGVGNGTRFGWNDASQELLIRGLHVNLPLIAEYANNAAAISGGLAVGDLYQTTTGGDAFVKRVI